MRPSATIVLADLFYGEFRITSYERLSYFMCLKVPDVDYFSVLLYFKSFLSLDWEFIEQKSVYD
jgi:hypothetical protein